MTLFYNLFVFVWLFIWYHDTEARKSVWVRTFDQDSSKSYTIFPNTMFKGGSVTVQVICSSGKSNAQIQVRWILEELECMEELFKTTQAERLTDDILTEVTYEMLQTDDHFRAPPDRVVRDITSSNVTKALDSGSSASSDGSVSANSKVTADTHIPPVVQVSHDAKILTNVQGSALTKKTSDAKPDEKIALSAKVLKFMVSPPQSYTCFKKNVISLKDESNSPYYIGYYKGDQFKDDPDYFRWRRMPNNWTKLDQHLENRVATVWESGVYHFNLKIEPKDEEFKFNATVLVKMKSGNGYLPAIEWPLLPVRGVLALLYLSMGTAWILIWAKSHQHSLKIHMIIGAVAVAGALANTLSFVELSDQNATGKGIEALKWLSIFLSVLQNGLMQLLVMIVATGYGITRPQLHKSLFASAVCLTAVTTLSQFLSVLVLDEDIRIKYSHPVLALGMNSVYAIFSLITAGWLMVFALMTFLHLCRRKHSSRKIISFTIFTVTCVLTFFVSLILSLVSLGITKECSKDWRLEWLFKSYSSMTSLVLMVVLMWLWRPVDQAQIYAFTPLNTEDIEQYHDEDDEDETLFDKTELRMMDT